jgi:AcrR family transcriptional regulator
MNLARAETQALDAAEALFYRRGIQAVGMDAVRAASGVSLKRMYQLFASKEELVTAFLRRRDLRWRQSLADFVNREASVPDDRVLAVFDWLYLWFSEPGYRGCAWVNAFGELGATSPAVAAEARRHKDAFKAYLDELVAGASRPKALAGHLWLLAEGAMTAAAISDSPQPAQEARTAAQLLLDACPGATTTSGCNRDASL